MIYKKENFKYFLKNIFEKNYTHNSLNFPGIIPPPNGESPDPDEFPEIFPSPEEEPSDPDEFPEIYPISDEPILPGKVPEKPPTKPRFPDLN